MLNKLNGWQRLWVVVSIAMGIVLAFYAFLQFQTPSKHIDFRPDEPPADCAQIARQVEEEWRKSHPREILDPDLLSDIHYSNLEYKTCADKAVRQEEIKWNREFKVKFVVNLFLAWIATSAFIYGAGFSVAWVRGGFRHKNE
jgi:hypothetical protein